MSPSQIALGLATLVAFVYTVLAYPHKYGALSGRSRLFRTIGVSLLDLLLLLVLMATFIDFTAGVGRSIAAIRFIFYVASCFSLCFALVCVAALDALESYSLVRRERKSEMERTLLTEITKARAELAAQDNTRSADDPANSGSKLDGG